jgi:hypothetical protein
VKPWTERNQIASALRNDSVRVGERTLKDGTVLRGLYATKNFAVGDYVAAFHGRTIPRAQYMALHTTDRALFDRISEYAIAVRDGGTDGHLYPENVDSIGAHLINHACRPNTSWGRRERGSTLVRATAPIAAGEEITAFYGWLGIKSAFEEKRHACSCAAPFCVGTIELFVEIIHYDDRTVGPNVPHEEVSKRLLADIMNETNEHEALLLTYADGSVKMIHGAERTETFNYAAYYDKLHKGAEAAVRMARRLEREVGLKPSSTRLRQISATYDVVEGNG